MGRGGAGEDDMRESVGEYHTSCRAALAWLGQAALFAPLRSFYFVSHGCLSEFMLHLLVGDMS